MSETFGHVWTLHSVAPPLAVWRVISDTDRINRLARTGFRYRMAPAPDGKGMLRIGEQRHLGMRLVWHEHPVLFQAPQRYEIKREYLEGPLSLNFNRLTLTPSGGGTDIRFEVELHPRKPWMRKALALDFALTVRPRLERALYAVVAAIDKEREPPDLPAEPLSREAARRISEDLCDVEPREVTERLATFLREAPTSEQQRMRPIALARAWGLPPRDVTRGLLNAAGAGVLDMQWELLCPSCRGPANTQATFGLHGGEAHCPGCDVRYDASIVDSVVLSFRPSPLVRLIEPRMDCMSSPARMSHVVAQRQLPPRQESDWTLTLEPGTYRLRVPSLMAERVTLNVRAEASRSDAAVIVGPRTLTPQVLRLKAGNVTLRLRSKMGEPKVLLVERASLDTGVMSLGRLLEWPEVAAALPSSAIEDGLLAEPHTGPAIALQIARGGRTAEREVAALLRGQGARALQASSGWVTATFQGWQSVAALQRDLQGAPWLSAAVGYGTLIELGDGKGVRWPAGAFMEGLVASALGADAGQWLLHAPASLPEDVRAQSRAVLGWPEDAERDVLLDLPQRTTPPMRLPTLRADPIRLGEIVDDRFRLVSELGQGGFGVVFAAEDTTCGAPVVVKLLRPELGSDPAQVQRFFDEGRLAARLRGDRVVRLHEWGLGDDGRLFLVMERLHGRELHELLTEQGTLDPPRAMALCVHALEGLAEAHAQGLVHRDIKPQNLFVIREGEPDEAIKVIDFGIALDLTGRVGSPGSLGEVIGTPTHMSPEQVAGLPIDARTDLYALGTVLYESLAGELPFSGDTMLQILLARLQDVPVPLVKTCRQPLPHGLESLVDSLLARDRDLRPASAGAVAAMLRQVLANAGDRADWIASWQRHRQPRRRPGAQGSDLSVELGDTIPLER